MFYSYVSLLESMGILTFWPKEMMNFDEIMCIDLQISVYLWNAQGCIDKQLQWFMNGFWYIKINHQSEKTHFGILG